MSEAEAGRAALRRALAPRLGRLGTPLELIAEDVVGEEDATIDWIAASSDGAAWVVLVEPLAAEHELLVRALAQRAWVAARVADWCKLAPSLSLRSEIEPRLLLVAREFDRMLRIAAREASADPIRLARWSGDAEQPDLELLEPLPRVRRPAPALPPAAPRALASVFRTGLTEADLTG
ncbi:MAG: hypothetical protein DCC71_05640 [Proteobacteria bacterium]|nr:MAG: hypothetical protein DCC71_05640 [Pseudomonadota bacterium]